MTKIGFIGLGDQGAPIAHALADAGYALQVWARRPESLTALEGTPYTAHPDVASVATASEVVALCLGEDADNLQVATTGGVLENLGVGLILINHGTGTPAAAQELTDLAALVLGD